MLRKIPAKPLTALIGKLFSVFRFLFALIRKLFAVNAKLFALMKWEHVLLARLLICFNMILLPAIVLFVDNLLKV